jgi:NADPH-dependent 2,4-dienoyl-CoA reductase/sulfur reductase-like enzyme
MERYKYLVVGGGMTAAAAVEAILEADAGGSIGLIGDESRPPYNRPPLSKGLWKGAALERIWRKVDGQGLTQHLGRRVQRVYPAQRRVTDDRGAQYEYDRLLLATGGTPCRLPFGGEDILYFRTLDDYERLRALTAQSQRFAVIGGGFIGWEIAAALTITGKDVVMAFPDSGIGARIFPAGLSEFLNGYYRSKGVEVATGERVEGYERRQGEAVLQTRGETQEREITADAVVAGIGIQPNVDLAQDAGLDVENGIWVDGGLRTSHPEIYAAGDVANFYNPILGRRLRVEHEDNANTMGRLAGLAMAGRPYSYDHLPFFYSDLFDLGFEAVGDVDARLQMVEDWVEPFREGVVYYLRGGRVCGVLLWNVWGQVDAARRLIAEPGPFGVGSLRGRLPE